MGMFWSASKEFWSASSAKRGCFGARVAKQPFPGVFWSASRLRIATNTRTGIKKHLFKKNGGCFGARVKFHKKLTVRCLTWLFTAPIPSLSLYP